jgi:hypothetical protein
MNLPDFYLTFDDEFYFDLQLHLGRLRVECGGTTPQDRGSTGRSDHQYTDGEDPPCL